MAINIKTGLESGNNLTFGKQVQQCSFAKFDDIWEVTGTHNDNMLREIFEMLKEKFKGE